MSVPSSTCVTKVSSLRRVRYRPKASCAENECNSYDAIGAVLGSHRPNCSLYLHAAGAGAVGLAERDVLQCQEENTQARQG